MIHDGILFHKPIFINFKESKMFHIRRNPVDIIYSWISKKIDHSKDEKKNFHNYLMISKKKNNFHNYWFNKDLKNIKKFKNYKEKIIYQVCYLLNKYDKVYRKLSPNIKKKIYLINFDRFVTMPKYELRKICKFLKYILFQ